MQLAYDGMILWFTGLPRAGKTTITMKLYERLKAEGANVHLLDGTVIRAMNNGRIGFSREERITHMTQVGNMARILKEQGAICLVALIAPYLEARQSILTKIGAIEIFVDAPLEVCQARDPSGLYAQALRGEIKNFSGIDDPYEPPPNPQVHLHSDLETPEESTNRVAEYLCMQGLIDDLESYREEIYEANPLEDILSRFPFASFLLFIKYGICQKAVTSFMEDCLQFFRLRYYPYKQRIMFVTGLPKSGTTWMRQLLSMVPGYCSRPIYDPSRSIMFGDISPLVFKLLPRYGYSVIKLHTRYTHDNFATIRNHVGKFIVMFRDIRDALISRYFHVVNDNSHRHHNLYKSLPKEESISHCINMGKDFIRWVKDWHNVALAHPNILLEVRYEDLHADVETTMSKVLSFFEVPYGNGMLKKMANTQLREPVDLRQSLSRGETKRNGRVGEWREHFTKEHKDHFKEMAGKLLIQLGYEKDEDW